ncbi:La-related protein 1A [Vitis vinifera]|uniref:La-related protein 1A n=1 Tax=Vitis vinifera TaxID=29760 RepID=A0A438D4P2_VITVI|nr:La-related protein 1A [Vitis vinifera]
MPAAVEVATSITSDGGAEMEPGLDEVGEKVNVDEEVKASPWKKPEDGSGAVAEAPVMGMESWPALDEARPNGGAGVGGGQAAARCGPQEGGSSPPPTPVSSGAVGPQKPERHGSYKSFSKHSQFHHQRQGSRRHRVPSAMPAPRPVSLPYRQPHLPPVLPVVPPPYLPMLEGGGGDSMNGSHMPHPQGYNNPYAGNFANRRPDLQGPGLYVNPTWHRPWGIGPRENVNMPRSVGPRAFIRPLPPVFGPAPGFIGRPGVHGPAPVYFLPGAPPHSFRVPPPFMMPHFPNPRFPMPAPEALNLRANILKQIEYYFSDENLPHDRYLLSLMDDQGWVPISDIAGFNRVKKMTTDIPFILDALRGSHTIECRLDNINLWGDRIRRHDDGSKCPPLSGQHMIASRPEMPMGQVTDKVEVTLEANEINDDDSKVTCESTLKSNAVKLMFSGEKKDPIEAACDSNDIFNSKPSDNLSDHDVSYGTVLDEGLTDVKDTGVNDEDDEMAVSDHDVQRLIVVTQEPGPRSDQQQSNLKLDGPMGSGQGSLTPIALSYCCILKELDLKLEYKRIRFQEEKDCQKVFKYSKSKCCDASGNKESNLDRRFVSSVWKGRSLEWAALPACGASRGIVILWDSNKFKCTEKVLGSFSVTVKLNFGEEGSFWLTSVYGPNKPLWRDFWLKLQDLYGSTFPRWCVGGDFNVIRRISKKMSDSRLTFNMRFENMWLLHLEFKEKFRDWWQECTVEGWEERTLRRRELDDLLLKEEVQWRQKSRIKWIKEGDCNSKFFHRMATGRRSRKFIKSLISEGGGETLSNIEVIYEEIVNFFGKLYSKPEVYQECWDVIKEDLMRVFLEFHTNGGNGFGGSLEKGVVFGIRLLRVYMGHILMDETPTWWLNGHIDVLGRLLLNFPVSNPILFLPAKFLWSSKALSKVKTLAWLVAHGKAQVVQSSKVGLGPSKEFEDMLVIAFKGLGNSLKGRTLWQIACLTLIWMGVCKRETIGFLRIGGRTEEMLWDLIRFYSSLWASCTAAFRGVPLSVLQLNWIARLDLEGGFVEQAIVKEQDLPDSIARVQEVNNLITKRNIWALKNRDGDSRFCSSPPGLANSRVSGSIEGRDGCEEPVHATSRRRHNKGFNKWQLSPKQQQRLFLSNSGNNGSSPPSSSVGFFFGSTPPEGHGTTSVKLASGILAGTSPPVGHNSKPSPPQHPSHQLLDERGLKQQKYLKFISIASASERDWGLVCSEVATCIFSIVISKQSHCAEGIDLNHEYSWA